MSERYSCKGIFDSHAHYFDRRFAEEAEGGADRILCEQVFAEGICGVINVGTNPHSSLRCIRQAQAYPAMYAAVGIHPEDCMVLSEDVAAEVEKIRALADTAEKRAEHKIVAIGEIGLDYYHQPVDRERQAAFFEAQLDLAAELSLPVIIHDREAHGDCLETVLRHPEVVGVFHSFSGSGEMAKELVKRGWYISFSGVLTFKNARKAREAAQAIPMDRILIETDCPYLSPEPFRGRLNHSGRLKYTAQMLAEIKGISYEEAVYMTTENTRRLFGIE